ncbi:unnamed protein product [Amoebophrya sp. A25]|nr:unnamed protein product [Amoebophrya sp. A25]|eukprot:GSA25T00026412001.1
MVADMDSFLASCMEIAPTVAILGFVFCLILTFVGSLKASRVLRERRDRNRTDYERVPRETIMDEYEALKQVYGSGWRSLAYLREHILKVVGNAYYHPLFRVFLGEYEHWPDRFEPETGRLAGQFEIPHADHWFYRDEALVADPNLESRFPRQRQASKDRRANLLAGGLIQGLFNACIAGEADPTSPRGMRKQGGGGSVRTEVKPGRVMTEGNVTRDAKARHRLREAEQGERGHLVEGDTTASAAYSQCFSACCTADPSTVLAQEQDRDGSVGFKAHNIDSPSGVETRVTQNMEASDDEDPFDKSNTSSTLVGAGTQIPISSSGQIPISSSIMTRNVGGERHQGCSINPSQLHQLSAFGATVSSNSSSFEARRTSGGVPTAGTSRASGPAQMTAGVFTLQQPMLNFRPSMTSAGPNGMSHGMMRISSSGSMLSANESPSRPAGGSTGSLLGPPMKIGFGNLRPTTSIATSSQRNADGGMLNYNRTSSVLKNTNRPSSNNIYTTTTLHTSSAPAMASTAGRGTLQHEQYYQNSTTGVRTTGAVAEQEVALAGLRTPSMPVGGAAGAGITTPRTAATTTPRGGAYPPGMLQRQVSSGLDIMQDLDAAAMSARGVALADPDAGSAYIPEE